MNHVNRFVPSCICEKTDPDEIGVNFYRKRCRFETFSKDYNAVSNQYAWRRSALSECFSSFSCVSYPVLILKLLFMFHCVFVCAFCLERPSSK